MASSEPAGSAPLTRKPIKEPDHGLISAEMVWLAWLPLTAITIFHYSVGSEHNWVHDVGRRLYYLPILFAAFSRGMPGGLSVAIVASLCYIPHAFLSTPEHMDPGSTLNKVLEIVLYNAVGLIAGVLADREADRRRQAERAFEHQRRTADQLVRAGRLAALGELVAGIAHEVKNPLHTIKGTAEIVDEIVPKDSEQAPMWRLLRQEVNRLETVAERFLSFARPSAPQLRPYSAEQVYGRIAELVSAQLASESDVLLTIKPLSFAVAATTVRADCDQVAQIMLGITANALKAMNRSGTLTLRGALHYDETASYLAIFAENDGPGIPPEDLERIFDPFFTASEGGTGLGLSIAARIAEEHDGFLSAENKKGGKGVYFTLFLPCIGDIPSQPNESPEH